MALRRGALVPPKMDMEEEEDMGMSWMDIVIEDTGGGDFGAGGGGGAEDIGTPGLPNGHHDEDSISFTSQ